MTDIFGGLTNKNRGPPGKRGLPGPNGKNGEKGAKGSKGDTGNRGDKGLKGDKGEKGLKGDTGLKGEPGIKGDKGLKGDIGEKGLKGDKGEKGEQGNKGEKGEHGNKGEKGEPGIKGNKGDIGIKGNKGEKGDKGDIGTKGSDGVKGKPGKNGKSYSFYSELFEVNDYEWDIDIAPNFFKNGYDISYSPFKLLNKNNHTFDFLISNEDITLLKQKDVLCNRYAVYMDKTVNFSASYNLTGGPYITDNDNYQIFIVYKRSKTDISSNISLFSQPLSLGFGDIRFINLNGEQELLIGGVDGEVNHIKKIAASSFLPDHNPLISDKYLIFSVHYNRTGDTGCGTNKSYVYVNGKLIYTFTASTIDQSEVTKAITIGGNIKSGSNYNFKGCLGRFLIIGIQKNALTQEEIVNIHNYLKEEWKIEKKPLSEDLDIRNYLNTKLMDYTHLFSCLNYDLTENVILTIPEKWMTIIKYTETPSNNFYKKIFYENSGVWAIWSKSIFYVSFEINIKNKHELPMSGVIQIFSESRDSNIKKAYFTLTNSTKMIINLSGISADEDSVSIYAKCDKESFINKYESKVKIIAAQKPLTLLIKSTPDYTNKTGEKLVDFAQPLDEYKSITITTQATISHEIRPLSHYIDISSLTLTSSGIIRIILEDKDNQKVIALLQGTNLKQMYYSCNQGYVITAIYGHHY